MPIAVMMSFAVFLKTTFGGTFAVAPISAESQACLMFPMVLASTSLLVLAFVVQSALQQMLVAPASHLFVHGLTMTKKALVAAPERDPAPSHGSASFGELVGLMAAATAMAVLLSIAAPLLPAFSAVGLATYTVVVKLSVHVYNTQRSSEQLARCLYLVAGVVFVSAIAVTGAGLFIGLWFGHSPVPLLLMAAVIGLDTSSYAALGVMDGPIYGESLVNAVAGIMVGVAALVMAAAFAVRARLGPRKESLGSATDLQLRLLDGDADEDAESPYQYLETGKTLP
jgi:hypothetical protein